MIGKYLAHRLCKDPNYDEVVCTTYHSSVSAIDSKLFFRNSKIKLVDYQTEISNQSSIFDEIWHFATYGQPGRFRESWEGMVKANSHDIGRLNEKLSDIGHFYYASSSEVYGSIDKASESDDNRVFTSGIRGIYTESKLLGELIIQNIIGKDRSTSFRICLTYAPAFRFDDKRVLYELIIKAIVDGCVSLIDDGSAIRQYLYIDDAINMMLGVRDKRSSGSTNIFTFNISNPNYTSIHSAAKMIADFFNVDVKPGKGDPHLGALKSTEVIPVAYNSILGSYSYTDLKTGIAKVCQFASEHYKV